MPPAVLFLADPDEDYVADTLFHGLRTVLGPHAVDFPKRPGLYDSYPADRRGELYGRGFSIYGLLEDVDVDRADAVERAIAGEFDAVIFGTIWRDWHWWAGVQSRLPARVAAAVVDGSDLPWVYPYGPPWWKTPRRWALPRTRRRAIYFKREWTRTTAWLGRLGRVPVEPIAISLPAEKMVDQLPHKRQRFARHVVDLEVAALLGRSEMKHERSYSFEHEDEYVADLRSARYGITTKRAGWDALRHYEIAAAGAVPCFRALADKPARSAPHGLVHGANCIAYEDADDLMRQVGEISDEAWRGLADGALRWAHANTTKARAEQVLRTLGLHPA